MISTNARQVQGLLLSAAWRKAMLARKPLTRSQRGFRMKYPSLKLGRMVACESLLEGDLVLLLEFSPGVLFYQEQPARIEYWDGGQMREYFPDFEICLIDGTQAHLEVKPLARLVKPKIASKFRAIAKHYQQLGKQFRIVTERELHREPLRTNLRKLSYLRGRARRELPTTDVLFRILGDDPRPLAFVEANIGQSPTWQLLALGRLACDLTRAITPNTLVTLTQGGWHATVFL
jgi:hypothetical protein